MEQTGQLSSEVDDDKLLHYMLDFDNTEEQQEQAHNLPNTLNSKESLMQEKE